MRFKLFILLFFFISALVIVSNGNLHLKNSSEAKNFANLYYSWLIHTFGNIFKTTAYVVGFNWLPEKNLNGTNASSSHVNSSFVNISNNSR